MSSVWLFLVAVVVLVVWAVAKSRAAAPLAEQPKERGLTVVLTNSRQPATEFDKVLRQIDALWKIDEPTLDDVQKLGDLLCRAYPSFMTLLQQREIARIVPQALVGKLVAWELDLDAVRERDECFVAGGTDTGGVLVKLVKPGPLVLVECQTFDRGVVGLPRGHPVLASGRIVCATVRWPALSFTVTDAVLSSPEMESASRRELDALKAQAAFCPPPLPVSRVAPALEARNADPPRAPSYQTAPLAAYSKELSERAEGLFETVQQRLGQRARKCKGSFSVYANSSSETSAKIVIYQHGLGRRSGEWPALADGIYILIRCDGMAGRRIWQGELPGSSAYRHRLDPNKTLGIAPKHQERFAYFRFEPGDAASDIADLLATCSSA